jgi:VWFA-related protein
MTKFTVTFSITGLCLLAPLAGIAGEDGSHFRVDVRMVEVRATVTDSLGREVPHLTKNDFRVYENGVKQQINQVVTPQAPAASPSTVFVLFDTSNRMYTEFPFAEDCVADFIRNLSPSDAIAVYTFTRNVTRLTPPTKDRFAAIEALRHAVVGDSTSLYDSILLTLRDASKVRGSKVIVVFSNGPDTSSMLSADDVRGVAEDEGIPIYVLSTRDTNMAKTGFRDLTGNTGGKTYIATDWQRQKLAFEAIADDLNSSYLITYYPRTADESYRKIEIKVVGDQAHDYRIRARTGYRPSRADVELITNKIQ